MSNIQSSFCTSLVAAISMLALTFTSPAPALAEEPIPSITVSGTGTQAVKPDMAVIMLGVQRQARTARQALNQNNAAMKAVLTALKAFNIADKDLQTSGFSIQPRYNYPKRSSDGSQRPPEIIGYMVSNQLSVRIRDLEKLGDILDETVTLGVNSGGNIRFITDDPESALSQARKKAMIDAIAKATTLTQAAGIGLGKILSINESSRRPRPVAIRELAMARSAAAESVPVAAGENSYSVTVQVRWQILQ